MHSSSTTTKSTNQAKPDADVADGVEVVRHDVATARCHWLTNQTTRVVVYPPPPRWLQRVTTKSTWQFAD